MNASVLGRRLKRFFASARAYDLLDSDPETYGSTWSSGGCYVAATALHSLLPGSRLTAVVADGVQHHVVVELGGWYFDADGATGAQALLRRWRTRERLDAPRLQPFVPQAAADLVCPAGVVAELRRELQKLL